VEDLGKDGVEVVEHVFVADAQDPVVEEFEVGRAGGVVFGLVG
jgi:hypothetical protein